MWHVIGASGSPEELQRARTNAEIMAHSYHHHPMDEYEECDRREPSLDARDGSRSLPVPPQSQIPQHIEYMLRGTLDVRRTMRNAKLAPQRGAQRAHGDARIG